MAHLINRTTLVNAVPTDTIQYYKSIFTIEADASGELSYERVNITDGDLGDNFKVLRVISVLTGFSAALYFDAIDSNDRSFALQLPSDNPMDFNFESMFAGLPTSAGATANGNISITTSGLNTGDSGVIIILCRKG